MRRMTIDSRPSAVGLELAAGVGEEAGWKRESDRDRAERSSLDPW